MVLGPGSAAHVIQAVNADDDEEAYMSYLTNQSGTWQLAYIDNCYDYGYFGYPAAAIDSLGRPAVAYGTWGLFFCRDDRLWYRSRIGPNGWNWSLENVDGSPGRYGRVSLATSQTGTPTLVYDLDTGDPPPYSSLKYATKIGSNWETSIIVAPSPGWSGSHYPSVALDSDGTAHVSYYEPTLDNLVYATRLTGAWAMEIVDSVGDVGRYSAIELDSEGNPHISYQDFTRGVLRYAWRKLGQWTKVDVDTVEFGGYYSSLALDFTNSPHIASMTYPPANLRYARIGSITLPEPTSVEGGAAIAPRLLVMPNPSFIGETQIEFRSPYGANVRIDIVDAAGRRVRRLSFGSIAPEVVTLGWDGLDDCARPVGPGTYFVVASTGVRTVSAKLQLLR
jgi:hypothetical protein